MEAVSLPSQEDFNTSDFLERLRRGDDLAWKQLLNQKKDKLLKRIIFITGDKETALDLYQDTCEQAFRSIASFRGESRIETWLYTIANNNALMYRRRKNWHHRREHLINGEEKLQGLEELEVAELRVRTLRRAVETLKPKQYGVAMLRLEELPDDDIAEILGIPPATVRTRASHARGAIRSAFADISPKVRAEIFTLEEIAAIEEINESKKNDQAAQN
jgi:RNA polymerase sigma-70 factor (ECF subfamily)